MKSNEGLKYITATFKFLLLFNFIQALDSSSFNNNSLIINGGDLPKIDIYHQPIWMNENQPQSISNNKDDQNDLPQEDLIRQLSELNSKLDSEINKYRPNLKKNNSEEPIFNYTIQSNNLNKDQSYNQNLNMNHINKKNPSNSKSNNENRMKLNLYSQNEMQLNDENNNSYKLSSNNQNIIKPSNNQSSINIESYENQYNNINNLNLQSNNKNMIKSVNNQNSPKLEPYNENQLYNQDRISLQSNNQNYYNPESLISDNSQLSKNNQNSKFFGSYPKFTQIAESQLNQINKPLKLAEIKDKFVKDFNENERDKNCVRKEGMLKIRENDVKDKEVSVTYSILTKDRLSYFVNPKDETSIQGSIELSQIIENIKLINGFPSCFTIKTLNEVSDCSVCAENDESARDWINSITQNTVNCNTIYSLKTKGLLK